MTSSLHRYHLLNIYLPIPSQGHFEIKVYGYNPGQTGFPVGNFVFEDKERHFCRIVGFDLVVLRYREFESGLVVLYGDVTLLRREVDTSYISTPCLLLVVDVTDLDGLNQKDWPWASVILSLLT